MPVQINELAKNPEFLIELEASAKRLTDWARERGIISSEATIQLVPCVTEIEADQPSPVPDLSDDDWEEVIAAVATKSNPQKSLLFLTTLRLRKNRPITKLMLEQLNDGQEYPHLPGLLNSFFKRRKLRFHIGHVNRVGYYLRKQNKPA